MLLQAITPQGSVSADYTLVLALGIIGFLLISIAGIVGNYFINALREIKRELSQHRDLLSKHQTLHELAMQRDETISNFDANTFADQVILKIRAMGAAFNTSK